MSEFAFRPLRGRRRATLNLTSLIDVLFLLLIFFMLTSTFRRSGEMQLSLPESETSSPSASGSPSERTEIVLLEDGSLRVDGEALTQEEVLVRLQREHEENPDQRIVLKAAAEARHADVVRLYDLVREVGFRGFTLGTEIRRPGNGGGASESSTSGESP